ncbi:MAG TPA: hypothetical protein VKG80_00955 [Trebonia sp.]|nr:hypothetical protein [Trebonia sp.]
MKTSRVAVLAGALVTAVALAGCGSTTPIGGGGGGTAAASSPAAGTGAGTGTPRASGAASSSPAAGGAGATRPAGGPVPAGFAATSVTFVSPEQAFVLGTAPCSHAPCTSIVRTLDRGASWRGLPAPVVPLGQPQNGAGPAVWGIRFADPGHGFVFGDGLWETTDGGEHWAAAAGPGGAILSLEVIDGQVLALTSACGAQNGCAQTGTLMRRALSGGAWHAVTPVREPGTIATQARVAAVLDGSDVIVTGDGGLTYAVHATPCGTEGMAWPSSVAVSGPDGLALLCAGSAAMGSVDKTVYVSGDLGAHWAKAGSPARGGDPAGIAAATPAQLVIAAESGASWLYHSADSAAQWGTAYQAGDGGQGWNDLGFTTTSDGVVVHGPAFSDGNKEGRPGQLLLTSDGGASWQLVRF